MILHRAKIVQVFHFYYLFFFFFYENCSFCPNLQSWALELAIKYQKIILLLKPEFLRSFLENPNYNAIINTCLMCHIMSKSF